MKFNHNSRLQSIVLFAMACLLYANTLHHGFVLDDDVVIVRNQFVQQGTAGIWSIFSNDSFAGFERIGTGDSILEGGRYRPLSLVLFAFLQSLFGQNPLPYHFLSILLFAITGIVIFRVSGMMFKSLKVGSWAAFIVAALFIVHPLHTEVVANIKSADELLALLFGLTSMIFMFKAFDSGSGRFLVLAGLSMLLACFSKEHAITFVVLAPLALWYFRKATFATVIRYGIPFLAGGIVFIMCRAGALEGEAAGSIMHDPLNNPFLQWDGQAWMPCGWDAKLATILYTFGRYVLLMLVPHPLTHDYLPFHIPLQGFTNPLVLASLFALIGMVIFSIRSFQKKWPAGYGVLFFLIPLTLVSNLVFPIGTFMAERFLYMSSFGFILAIAILGYTWLKKEKQNYFTICVAVVMVVFSAMTVARNAAWKDNESLLRADVQVSVNSIKLQNDLGTALLEKAGKESDPAKQKQLLEEAFPHLQQAVKLHPTYYDALLAYGACAYYVQQYDLSVDGYRKASRLFPGDPKSMTGLGYALKAHGTDQWMKGDRVQSISNLTEAWTIQPDSAIAVQLSTYFRQLGRPEESNVWLARANSGSN